MAPATRRQFLADVGRGVLAASVGSGLARAAWGAFIRAARAIASDGRFDVLAEGVSHAELNRFFRDRAPS